MEGGVTGEGVIEGRKLGTLKHHERLILEGDVDRPTLIVFKANFLVISNETMIFPGGCTCVGVEYLYHFMWMDELFFIEKFTLGQQEDESKVDTMEPSNGDIERRRFFCQETLGVSYFGVVCFPQVLWEGRGW